MFLGGAFLSPKTDFLLFRGVDICSSQSWGVNEFSKESPTWGREKGHIIQSNVCWLCLSHLARHTEAGAEGVGKGPGPQALMASEAKGHEAQQRQRRAEQSSANAEQGRTIKAQHKLFVTGAYTGV